MIHIGFIEVLDKNSDTMINMKEPNREAFGALLATVGSIGHLEVNNNQFVFIFM